MKPLLSTTLATATLLIANLHNACASGVTEHVDTTMTYNSGILVLAFAGFLALVVVVQLIPAAISLYGMIKSAAEQNKERQAARANAKH